MSRDPLFRYSCNRFFTLVHDWYDLGTLLGDNRCARMRADFERSMGGQHILQTDVQTLSEDYLLTIEIYALSGNDEQIAVDSLQKFIIDE